MVDTTVILHIAHCFIACCCSMLFICCIWFLSTKMKFLVRANKVCLILYICVCECMNVYIAYSNLEFFYRNIFKRLVTLT